MPGFIEGGSGKSFRPDETGEFNIAELQAALNKERIARGLPPEEPEVSRAQEIEPAPAQAPEARPAPDFHIDENPTQFIDARELRARLAEEEKKAAAAEHQKEIEELGKHIADLFE
ncbi:MAG TPA: hypothetical protein VMC43_02600 [Candidatus Paceibacterota bacterium]|nr:hypothetical protein [Candidatus Paceibacterota bacterium]